MADGAWQSVEIAVKRGVGVIAHHHALVHIAPASERPAAKVAAVKADQRQKSQIDRNLAQRAKPERFCAKTDGDAHDQKRGGPSRRFSESVVRISSAEAFEFRERIEQISSR